MYADSAKTSLAADVTAVNSEVTSNQGKFTAESQVEHSHVLLWTDIQALSMYQSSNAGQLSNLAVSDAAIDGRIASFQAV